MMTRLTAHLVSLQNYLSPHFLHYYPESMKLEYDFLQAILLILAPDLVPHLLAQPTDS